MAARERRIGRGAMVVATLLACASASAQSTASRAGIDPLRPADARARALVEATLAASPTVADLLTALARTDVLVIVQVTLGVSYAGDLRFAARAGAFRLLIVRVSAAQSPRDCMAMLGHELQHAWEVAEAADVQDEAGLVALMRRIGRTTNGSRFETQAAVEIGRQVRREVTVRPAARVAGPPAGGR